MAELENRILESLVTVGVTNRKSFENRSTSVLRLCIVCVGEIAHKAWATKLSEVQDVTTFRDKYDITGRTVQFLWHVFSGRTANQIMRTIQTFLAEYTKQFK